MDSTDYTTQQVIFRELNSIAADNDCVLSFFQAHQVSEIILNESYKNTEHALVEWLRNETTRCFTKTKIYVVSLVLSLVFKTVFGIFLAPLVCLKSVK
jgi:hypothetical protein